jgi:hypothetical protein
MMSRATSGYLFLSFFVMSAGTIGGMAITWTLVDAKKSLLFLCLGLAIQFAIFSLQILLYPKARKELVFQLRYLAAFALAMVWVMLCLFLPIFFAQFMSAREKFILVVFSMFVFYRNFYYAVNYINRKWESVGVKEFDRLYRPAKEIIDWDKVALSLNVTPAFYIPGLPTSWHSGLSIFLVASILIGLTLRNLYPVISLLAAGVPSMVAASFFMQMSGYYFGQACLVKRIEIGKGIKLKLVP